MQRQYERPSGMFEARAKKAMKRGDVEYAQYKQAKQVGDKKKEQKHYQKSQAAYKKAKEEKEKAEMYKGKSWEDLKASLL